jgi:hypothetical protein
MKKVIHVCMLLASFSSALYAMEDALSVELQAQQAFAEERAANKKAIEDLQKRVAAMERLQRSIIVRGQIQLNTYRKYARDLDPNYVLPNGEFNVRYYEATKEKQAKEKKWAVEKLEHVLVLAQNIENTKK